MHDILRQSDSDISSCKVMAAQGKKVLEICFGKGNCATIDPKKEDKEQITMALEGMNREVRYNTTQVRQEDA